MNARPYQQRIIDQAIELLPDAGSVLIEMAPGTGKTFVGATVAKRLATARVLWVAHRIELVKQAAEALERVTGEPVGLEIPGSYAGGRRLAVASRDTIAGRLNAIGERQYSVLVIDEAHHTPTYRYESIIRATNAPYRIGLTATPDRADRKSVRQWYKAATDPYDLPTAIRDAWLVPFHARRVRVHSIDLSRVHSSGRDFNQEELDAVLSAQASIEGMAAGIRKFQGQLPTLVYCSSVSAAEAMWEAIDRNSTRIVLGDTDPDERAELIEGFGKDYQTLVSVGVLTEGVDLPIAACVAMCRPTKSRSLYTQMLCRVGRPHRDAGLDAVNDTAPADRQALIAFSIKPRALVLDFVGVCGKHSVVTPADVLGGSATARARVKKQIEAGVRTIDVAAAIEQEESRLARKRAEKEAKDREWALRQGIELPEPVVSAQEIGIVGIDGKLTDDMEVTPVQPSEAKKLFLLGHKPSAEMKSGEARKTIATLEADRKSAGMASLGQLELLSRYGQASPSLKASTATGMILQLKRNGWKPIGGRKAA